MNAQAVFLLKVLDSPELNQRLERLADAWHQLVEIDCPAYHELIMQCHEVLERYAINAVSKAIKAAISQEPGALFPTDKLLQDLGEIICSSGCKQNEP
jgi:hypothetical protein